MEQLVLECKFDLECTFDLECMFDLESRFWPRSEQDLECMFVQRCEFDLVCMFVQMLPSMARHKSEVQREEVGPDLSRLSTVQWCY